MGMKHFKAYTPSRRNMAVSTYEEVTKTSPEKSLLEKKRKNAGRKACYAFTDECARSDSSSSRI